MQAFSVSGTFLVIQTAARIPEGIRFACKSVYVYIYMFVFVSVYVFFFRDF